MVSRLQKRQPKSQNDMPKANVLKRFGGKFKKAFSRKKQPLAQDSNEPYVEDIRSETTALTDTFPNTTEQLCTENAPDVVPIHSSINEDVQILDNHSAELATTPAVPSTESCSQDVHPEVDLQNSIPPSTPQRSTESSESGFSTPISDDKLNTGTNRNALRRSNSVPPWSSPPTTAASGDTLCNTSPSSDTSWSPSFIKFRQAIDEHRQSTQKGEQARADFLKNAEVEASNTDWVALMAWMKISNQAEMKQLEEGHAAEVAELTKDRSDARRRLELRNRELRVLKREMKSVKKAAEETAKEKEAISTSDTESADKDEGGVALHVENAATAEEAEKSCETNPSALEDADHSPVYTRKDKGKAKEARYKTTQDEWEHRKMLKQQLLDDSAPDFIKPQIAAPRVQPAATGGVGSNIMQQQASFILKGNYLGLSRGVKGPQDHNEALKANLAYARKTIAQLRSEAESAKENNSKLRAENNFAQLEVGHCHAVNAGYRAALEDENPARTAHLDGLLTRKDEAYAELEKRAAECAELLWEEKKQSSIDSICNLRYQTGLKKELAHRLNTIEALTKGKEALKEGNDKIFQMLKGKIFQDDAVKAIFDSYELLQKDNDIMASILQERECYVIDAEKNAFDLSEEAISQEHAMEKERQQHRQTMQSLNGLTAENEQLKARLEMRDEDREAKVTEMEAKLQEKQNHIDQLIAVGVNPLLAQHLQAQDAHIATLNANLTSVNRAASFWHTRALEQQEGWCPMFNYADVTDWEGEEARYRLLAAERDVGRLKDLIKEMKRVMEREVGRLKDVIKEMKRGTGSGMGDWRLAPEGWVEVVVERRDDEEGVKIGPGGMRYRDV